MRLAVVSAVNNDEILSENLLRSPMLSAGQIPLIVERGHDSAAKAYNAGMDRVDADAIVFAHQDVYFPRGWEDKLSHAIESYTALPFEDRPLPERPSLRPAYQGSNPISDVWSLQALRMVAQYLVREVEDPSDDEARALLRGFNFPFRQA